MGCKSPKVAFILGIVLVVVAGFMQMIAISLPWWAYKEFDFFGAHWQVNDGLWKTCQKTDDPIHGKEKVCITHAVPADYLTSTRSLLTFGLLLVGAGTVAVIIQKWCLKNMVMLAFIGSVLVCFGGLLSWVGTTTFTKQYVEVPGNRPEDIYICWILTLASSSSFFVSGSLFAARRICTA